jgi:N-acylneuraminate cytidylyltransferase
LKSNPETDFVFSATAFPYPIFRALRQEQDGSVAMFWPEYEPSRSQDLPAAYHDAGQFYWGRRDAWLNREGLLSASSRMILLPSSEVQDIDEPDDWKRAELMFRALQSSREIDRK